MLKRMRYPVYVVAWAATAYLPGCGISVDYDGTEYRCDQSGTCPDGYDCVDDRCVKKDDRPDDPDAAVFEPPPDADHGDDMLNEYSEPDLDIPDGFSDGVFDAISFDSSCIIDDITVDVEIYHEWRGDLLVELTAPSGTDVDLHDPGDDGGENLIGTYPTTLIPDQSLDSFFGQEGAGVWILRVADVDDGGDGTFESWAVHLWCQ